MFTRVSRRSRAQLVLVLGALAITCRDAGLPTAPTGGAAGPTSAPDVGAPAPDYLIGAGDVASCTTNNDEATAKLIDAVPTATVFTAGDNAYVNGTATEFSTCYGPTWGRHKARTRPVPGDRDYRTAGAADYFAYFGTAAGDPSQGYYSYDLGSWHVVMLNSAISTAAGSPQEQWLRQDLAASTKSCTVAIFHHPRFSSTGTNLRSSVRPLWVALYEANAEVIINSEYRLYERFAPQDPDGNLDNARGIREFIVGTGGAGSNTPGVIVANSEVRISNVPGVLKLTLNATSYGWQFVPIAGKTDTDAGTENCHGSEPLPNQNPTANPGGPYASEGAVSFDGSASTDPDNNTPFTYAWDFGDGTTGTGVAPTHSYAADGQYTVSLTVTDSRGGTSAPATTTATIANIAPTVNAGGDAMVLPGGTFNLNATFTDPGANDGPWNYSIDWGDGSPATSSSIATQAPITASHVYPSIGSYTVTVTVTDKDGGAGSDALNVAVSESQTFVGAGDIADCSTNNDELTAQLLDAIPGQVFTIGDNAYENGTAAEFANCYEPTWGRHKARTWPSVGNHDYNTPNATPYYDYFGAAAGDPTKGYYSKDLGAWHIVILNSNIDESADSPQLAWLRADLAASTKTCTIAIWHHPRFSSSMGRTVRSEVKPFWDALYAVGAELILNGHDHAYERFELQRPDGTVDLQTGIRQITVGTGGSSLYTFTTASPNSLVRINSTAGVIKLSLKPDSYDWEFVPVAGRTVNESGTGICHGPPPPVADPGGPYFGESSVQFDGTASYDPQGDTPLTYAWTFGDGATGSGPSPSHIYAAQGSYTATLTVTDSRGNPSQPVSTAVTIANVAPTVDAGKDIAVLPGTFNLNATFTDPGGSSDAPWTFTINWGDGASESGSTTTLGGPIQRSHSFPVEGSYAITVTVTDKDGGTGSDQVVVRVTNAPSEVLVGAGDVAACTTNNDEMTARLLDNIQGTVFTIGDNAYPDGAVADYTDCFEPTWGRHKSRITPVPGDRDYRTAGASGYFGYFGAAAGDPAKGYYSYDLGTWHVVMLNSAISTAAGSPQELWLKQDLAANTKACTVAIWHHPRFSSIGTTIRPSVKPLWDDLYAANAEIVLNSDYRGYERFAPQNPDGVLDLARGIREFVVGTGGAGTNAYGGGIANSEVRNGGTPGVIKLTLADGHYDWQFVPIAGMTFTDSGQGTCH